MQAQICEEKLIQIFITVHDFIHPFQATLIKHSLGRTPQRPTRLPDLAACEVITLLVYYHHSGYKNFQYYYERLVLTQMRGYFPGLVSYNRFLELLPRQFMGLQALTRYLSSTNQRTGCYFIDAKKLPVCDNRRIHSHRVFEHFAGRGMSSTGWFYGLKLHLVINELGQIVNFCFSPANVADQNPQVLGMLLRGLQGRCYGDKGYLTARAAPQTLRGVLCARASFSD